MTSSEKKRGEKEAWVHFKELWIDFFKYGVAVGPCVWTKAQLERTHRAGVKRLERRNSWGLPHLRLKGCGLK